MLYLKKTLNQVQGDVEEGQGDERVDRVPNGVYPNHCCYPVHPTIWHPVHPLITLPLLYVTLNLIQGLFEIKHPATTR